MESPNKSKYEILIKKLSKVTEENLALKEENKQLKDKIFINSTGKLIIEANRDSVNTKINDISDIKTLKEENMKLKLNIKRMKEIVRVYIR